MKYIDLGLPSGIVWAESNEDGFYTFNEAVSNYGDNIPSKEQWEELIKECRWKWNGKGYNVTGHNGNTIVLPALGFHNWWGSMYGVGSYGGYWSSMPHTSDFAWGLRFTSGGVDMAYDDRCDGRFVRLVKTKDNKIKTKIAMNENINIAEILKDCPKGTKLYSPICGEVEFVSTSGTGFPVEVIEGVVVKGDADADESEYDDLITFFPDGRYLDYPNGECMLFPSRDNRDWSTFVPPTQDAETKVHTVSEDDKQLLMQDLCARLPYGVYIKGTFSDYDLDTDTIKDDVQEHHLIIEDIEWCEHGACPDIKPYLRSMGDMTDEERLELYKILYDYGGDKTMVEKMVELMNMLNEHHLDCRGLIEKGLAIRVTNENNPYKD